jgi:hypothetical protein
MKNNNKGVVNKQQNLAFMAEKILPKSRQTNLVCANEIRMKSSESANKPESNEAIYHKHQASWRVFQSVPYCRVVFVHEKLYV